MRKTLNKYPKKKKIRRCVVRKTDVCERIDLSEIPSDLIWIIVEYVKPMGQSLAIQWLMSGNHSVFDSSGHNASTLRIITMNHFDSHGMYGDVIIPGCDVKDLVEKSAQSSSVCLVFHGSICSRGSGIESSKVNVNDLIRAMHGAQNVPGIPLRAYFLLGSLRKDMDDCCRPYKEFWDNMRKLNYERHNTSNAKG